MVLGIQFITSGVSGQAKVKEKLIPYVIGCVVVFGGLGIWRITLKITKDTVDSNPVVQDSDPTTYHDTEDSDDAGGFSGGGAGRKF